MSDPKKPRHDDDRYSYLFRGKSELQRRLERELEEKQRAFDAENPAPPTPKRKPLKWYWWVAIIAGVTAWTALSFLTYDWTA